MRFERWKDVEAVCEGGWVAVDLLFRGMRVLALEGPGEVAGLLHGLLCLPPQVT